MEIWDALSPLAYIVRGNKGRKLKGLTSKEHLFLRVLSVVAVIDAVTFYVASRNLQIFISNFSETVTLITALTLFVLTVNLEFWWRYLRRTDNQRFWVSDFFSLISQKPKSIRNRELELD